MNVRAAARKVKANELGPVPVLMYHRITRRPQSVYDITPSRFRSELQRLFEEGYVPITAGELARGEIDVPAGKSPVVLTFDDGSIEQYRRRNGAPSPRSAVGIFVRFSRRHKDFPVAGTMFVNNRPFDGRPDAMESVTALGFELGNHTLDHANLAELSATDVQRQLREGTQLITEAVPDAEVRTLALPFGIFPARRSLAWEGTGYRHDGVFLVGAEPAPSPFARSFDAHAIPRIRAGGGELAATFWLNHLAGTRFVSDGDPGLISFPEGESEALDPRASGTPNPY